MKKLFSRVVVFGLTVAVLSLAGLSDATAGGHAPHFQKPAALRKAQAQHKAKKAEKKMKAKKPLFHH